MCWKGRIPLVAFARNDPNQRASWQRGGILAAARQSVNSLAAATATGVAFVSGPGAPSRSRARGVWRTRRGRSLPAPVGRPSRHSAYRWDCGTAGVATASGLDGLTAAEAFGGPCSLTGWARRHQAAALGIFQHGDLDKRGHRAPLAVCQPLGEGQDFFVNTGGKSLFGHRTCTAPAKAAGKATLLCAARPAQAADRQRC